MRHPWVNTALLILLAIQLATGLVGLINGWVGRAWVVWLHGIGGYAVLVLLLWKGAVIVESFRRRSLISVQGLGFLGLTMLLLVIMITGLVWTYAGPTFIGGYSLIVIHGLLSVVLFALFLWHVWARRFVLRVTDARNRRAFLRLGSSVAAGLVFWWAAKPVKGALHLPGFQRRFTGSYETGSYTGQFPETSWLFDNPPPVQVDRWRLVVDGLVEHPLSLTLAEVQALADASLETTLDCTGGWFSVQSWWGVSLPHLLEMAVIKPEARSVSIHSLTGYNRKFSIRKAQACLLAIEVAGETLSHGHGYPLRLVVPDHRGFDWVKWVIRIHVSESRHWLQPLLPLR